MKICFDTDRYGKKRGFCAKNSGNKIREKALGSFAPPHPLRRNAGQQCCQPVSLSSQTAATPVGAPAHAREAEILRGAGDL